MPKRDPLAEMLARDTIGLAMSPAARINRAKTTANRKLLLKVWAEECGVCGGPATLTWKRPGKRGVVKRCFEHRNQ